MKKLYFILPFLVGIIFSSNAQNLTKITEYLTNGDVTQLTNSLDEKVEVSILEKDSYSKEEAKPLLADFFLDKKDFTYTAIHKGNSEKKGEYQIGELSAKNDSYRTYFYTKNVNGEYLVQEIRIEKQ